MLAIIMLDPLTPSIAKAVKVQIINTVLRPCCGQLTLPANGIASNSSPIYNSKRVVGDILANICERALVRLLCAYLHK